MKLEPLYDRTSTMTAKDFFISIAEPTVQEFLAERSSIRRGMLAAIVLFHVYDYFRLENSVTTEDLIKKCPEFLTIRDVCNASKHAHLTNPAKPARILSASNQVSRTPGLFEAPFGDGVFKEAAEVNITLDNGDRRPFAPVVQAVLAMWEKAL